MLTLICNPQSPIPILWCTSFVFCERIVSQQVRVQDENKHTALHRRLVDAEEDRLVIEKQRSDVEEKRLEIEEQNET